MSDYDRDLRGGVYRNAGKPDEPAALARLKDVDEIVALAIAGLKRHETLVPVSMGIAVIS